MVSKFTSLNRTALFRTNSFRWASTYLFLIAMILGGAGNAYAQPIFTQCMDSNVTLPQGGAPLVLDNTSIPMLLNVMATSTNGLTYSAVPSMLECSDIPLSPVSVTVTATDNAGQIATCIIDVTVADGGPLASCIMAPTLTLNGGTGTIRAEDFDDGNSGACTDTTLLISDDGGATFFPFLTFDCNDFMMSPIPITFQVTDANMMTATCMTMLTLQDGAPTLTDCPMDMTVNVDTATCDQTVSIVPPTGMDNCANAGIFTRVTVSNPNVNLNNTASGGVLGNPNGVDIASFPVGTTTITYTLEDNAGNVVAPICEVDISVVDNQPPTIVCPTTTQTLFFASCNLAADTIPNYIGLSTPSDNCSSTNITTQFPAPGTLISTLNPMDQDTFIVTITVADTEASAMCTFTVTLEERDPIPDTDPLAPVNINCGSVIVPAPFALNFCGDTIYGIPDLGTLFSGIPGDTSSYEFTTSAGVNWSYIDNNAVTIQNQNIVLGIDMDPPTIVCKNDTVFLQGTSAVTDVDSIVVSFTDICGIDTTSLSVSKLTFDCDDLGTNQVFVSISDINGNADTCIATVTVIDNTPPVLFNALTFSQQISCAATVDTTGLNVFATDNCSTPPTINFTNFDGQGNNPAFSNFYNYTIQNTFTATDQSGNSSSRRATFFVRDLNVPVFAAGLSTNDTLSVGQNCEATASINFTTNEVFDSCAAFPFLDLSFTLVDNNGITLETGTGAFSRDLMPGIYTITYTATDPSSNQSIPFVRTYTVIDDTAPVVSCNSGTVTIGLPNSGSIAIIGQLIDLIDNNSFDNCTSSNDLVRTVTLLDGSPAVFTCDDISTTPIGIRLTVTDTTNGTFNSCTSSVIIQDNIAPQINCVDSISVSLDANGQAIISSAMIDNGTLDDCGGSVMLGVSPMVLDTSNLGQAVNVTLTATDQSGNFSTCVAVVTVTPPPTCFQVGQVSGNAGDTISIPVTVTDFVNVSSFQFALALDSTEVADFVGISNINPQIQNLLFPQLIETDTFISNIDSSMVVMDINGLDSTVYDTTFAFRYDQISLVYVSMGMPAVPANLPDGAIAFNIDLILMGELLDFASIIALPNDIVTPPEIVYEFGNNTANAVLIDEEPCINPNGDGVVNISNLVIAGQVITESGFGFPVNLVDVDLQDLLQGQTVVRQDQTGPDGTYSMVVGTNSDYRIIPRKDIFWGNGISIRDVAAIQRHAVGNEFLDSPYKKIAADLSNDGLITGGDALILNIFLSTGLTSNEPTTNTSWRFVREDLVLSNTPNAILPSAFTNPSSSAEFITILNINSDTLNNNFIGVKIGDVAGPFADPQQLNETGDSRSEDNLIFTLQDEALTAGEVYNLTFNAKNFDQLVGYQYILNYDPAVLRYVGNETLELDGFTTVGTTLTSEGRLVLTWYTGGVPITKEIEAALFNLSFEALEDAGTIQSLLSITELGDNFAAVAFNEADEPRDVKLEFTHNTISNKDFHLYQNTPNPFRGETVIGFDLPAEAAGTLDIMDVSGKLIKSYGDTFQKGYNQITVPASDLPAVGVLYYQLKTEEFTAIKKMILID